MSQDIRIIDPHIHLWDPVNNAKSITPLVKRFGKYPWLLDKILRLVTPKEVLNFVGTGSYFTNPHLPALYHQDTGKYKIDGFVHIQAGWEGEKPFNSVGETDWLMTLPELPLAIVGEAHLMEIETLESVLDAHAAASPLFRGVRDSIARHPDKGVMNFCETEDIMREDKFKRGYEILGKRGLSFDVFLYSIQLDGFIELVTEVKGTRTVLDHVGTPVGLEGPHGGAGQSPIEREVLKEKWYEDLARLAEVSDIHLKLSGLLMTFCGHQFENRKNKPTVSEVVDSIGPHIEYALKAFGVERCMFASNFPVDKVSVDFETLYEAYFQIVQNYSQEDQQKLFADNAVEFYRLNLT